MIGYNKSMETLKAFLSVKEGLFMVCVKHWRGKEKSLGDALGNVPWS